MMAEYVGVTGLDQVLKNLKGLDGELKRKGLLAGAKAGAGVFKKQIQSQSITPEDSGALKRSIGVRQMSKKLATKSDIVGAMVMFRTGEKRTKKQEENDRDAWYWFFHEYGWNAGGKYRMQVHGRHFIKKGFMSKTTTVKNSYEKRIAKFVDKYNGR